MASTQKNKRHKSRFTSKSRAAAHRTEQNKASRHIGKAHTTARSAHTKMIGHHKRVALLTHKRTTAGLTSAPRVIVLFGLSTHANIDSIAKDLLATIAGDERAVTSNTIASAPHKLRTTVLKAPHKDLLACMELAKAADLIGFVVSANDATGSLVDPFGAECLSVFRAMGLPSIAVFLRDLPMDIQSKHNFKKMTLASLASELPDDCKYYHADTKEDLHKFIRIFKEQKLSVPHWRTQRPYVMSHEVGVELGVDSQGLCTLIVSGYVRAHNLSINQLVHVSGVGDFQLDKVEVLKDPFPLSERKEYNFMDSDDNNYGEVVNTLVPDPLNQEPLIVENSPDPLAGEQTWPTEAEMAEAEEIRKVQKKKKRLPRGTSDYQAAWILNDTDNDDIDNDDGYEEDCMVLNEQGQKLLDEEFDHSDKTEPSHCMVDADEGTEADVDMIDDTNLTKEQIEAEIKKIKGKTAEDIEFPDEVDTPIDVPAKRRFAKYRGLKSFRTSSWDPMESLPPEFSRIFAFDGFSRTHKHVLEKVKDFDQGRLGDCAPVGSFVKLYIKHVPGDVASRLCESSKAVPLIACGLLQHESKMSVLHFSIKKHESYDEPIKSKDSLIFYVGFRQFIARPLFSSDNLNCGKHKMERFLHPGCFSVASVYAPICFPSLPLIALKHGERPVVAAIGSLKSVDPNRVVLKKIILTGYPQRVSKLKAIVRFMFHRPDDVRWFKPVDLWTKCGRRGRIKEPVGTHGAMKCLFSDAIQQHDTVCMSLYKRAYPKWPEHMYPR